MLTLENKQAIVEEVTTQAVNAQSVIAADYSGLSVGDMTALRASARQAGIYLRVVKNTLARRALADTEFDCMCESLAGQLVLAFSPVEPAAAARVLTDFAKENDSLVIKVVALRGKLLEAADADRLARMPSKDESISILMAVMKAPVEKLVRTLAEPNNKLARAIGAVRDQKQAA